MNDAEKKLFVYQEKINRSVFECIKLYVLSLMEPEGKMRL